MQEFGADALGAFGNDLAGGADRTAGHHCRARTPGSGRIGRHRGIAVDEADFRGVDAENLVGDLGQRRLHALAMRLHTDPQFQPAVGRHACGCLLVSGHHRNAPAGVDRRAVRSLFAIDGKSKTDQPAVRFSGLLSFADRRDVDRFKHASHGFRVIAAVEMLFGDVLERHLLRRYQIAPPDLIRLQPRFHGNSVQHEFECKADASSRHAAIRQNRALVGRRRIGAAAIGRHSIGARQNADDLRGFEAGRKRIRRVSSGIDGCLAIDAAQSAVAVGIDGDLVVVFATVGAGA